MAQRSLTQLPRRQLERMASAGAEVLECMRVLAETGDNIVGEILQHQGEFVEREHYPKGDVYDHRTHAQYYYHAHPANERFGEHGHFHTFLRPKGMPIGVKPVVLGNVPSADGNAALSHLIAISMDDAGVPIRLFTTNRWVTGETWYKAQDVVRMLDCFRIGHAKPSWPTNRWITAMLRLFRPQIEALLAERDATIELFRLEYPLVENVYEARELEITSYADIDVGAQIADVEAALRLAA